MAERLSRMNMRSEAEHEHKMGGGPPAKKILLAILILAAAAAVILILTHFLGGNKTYDGYEVLNTITLGGGQSEVLSYEGGVLKVTRDGAEAVDKGGKLLWNVTYNMKTPVADVCGKYAAVGDKNGRLLYIMDGTGSVNPINVAYPIVDVKAAEQSVAAVWTNDGVDDHIYIYDIEGTMLLDIETKASKDGFPMDIALSPDGKRLVTSYVTLDGIKMKAWVTFYNFGSVGQSYVDKIVGSFSYDDDIVPGLKFLDNENVAVCCGNKIDIYRIKELPELRSQLETEREIVSVFMSDGVVGFAAEEPSISGEYLIERYAPDGKRISSFTYTGGYSGLESVGENVLIYGGMWFGLYSDRGKVIFRTDVKNSIRQVYPLNGKDEFLVVGTDRADIIRLSGGNSESDEQRQ